MGQLGGGDPARSSAAAAGSVSVVAAVSASGAFEATGGGVGDFTLSGVTELTSIHSGTAGKAWPDMVRQADRSWDEGKMRYNDAGLPTGGLIDSLRKMRTTAKHAS